MTTSTPAKSVPISPIKSLHRVAVHDLERWLSSKRRQPLLLRGARQTGKTWLVAHFAKEHFRTVIRIDFMRDTTARAFFDDDLHPDRLVRLLAAYTGNDVNPDSPDDLTQTLIFFDEVQECPRALTSLKYFAEDLPGCAVIATGSYMGLAHHSDASFPVGKVDLLTLRPLTFDEFLENSTYPRLSSPIAAGDFERIHPAFAPILEEQLRDYMIVGGMPAAVAAYRAGESFTAVRQIQNGILATYDDDFTKHALPRLLERIRLVWRSLPSQFAKENRRFVYGVVRPGARARDFEESIFWLRDYGIITEVPCVSALRLPLSAYADLSTFKMFAVDTGLLAALAQIEPSALLTRPLLPSSGTSTHPTTPEAVFSKQAFVEFRGALTEQYVCQQLVAQGLTPYYWANPKGQAETDFDIDYGGMIYPIEVKSGTHVRSKSLAVATQKFGLPEAIRTSPAGYKRQDWLTNIPLWAIGGLTSWLDRRKETD